LAFCLPLVVLLIGNHVALERLHRARPGGRGALVHQAGRSCDYVVLGSSAAQRAVDFRLLGDRLQGSVYSLALSGTAFPEQHLALELLLTRNRVETLIWQVDTWGLSDFGYSYPFHEYHYLPFLEDPVVERNLTEYYGAGRTACWKWVPMYKYADFNLHLGLQNATRWLPHSPGGNDVEWLRAGKMSQAQLAHLQDDSSARWYRWDAGRKVYFEKILQLAKLHNLRVVMFLAPVYSQYAANERNREEFIDYYVRSARDYGIPFFICEDPTLVRDPTKFRDGSHLNQRGAEQFTAMLAQFIRSASSESRPPRPVRDEPRAWGEAVDAQPAEQGAPNQAQGSENVVQPALSTRPVPLRS
jgi:hypothetical protein